MVKKTSEAPHKKITEGPTPHGGSFSVEYFFDSKFLPVEEQNATNSILHEYDSKNRSLHRTYKTKQRELVFDQSQPKNEESPTDQKQLDENEESLQSCFKTIAISETVAIVKIDAVENSPSVDSQPPPKFVRAKEKPKPKAVPRKNYNNQRPKKNFQPRTTK